MAYIADFVNAVLTQSFFGVSVEGLFMIGVGLYVLNKFGLLEFALNKLNKKAGK